MPSDPHTSGGGIHEIVGVVPLHDVKNMPILETLRLSFAAHGKCNENKIIDYEMFIHRIYSKYRKLRIETPF